MSENISPDVLNQLKATNGQVITCKAAVAWEAKKPLDITDIQVRYAFNDNISIRVALGSFNNYVDKKRGKGVSRKATIGYVTKGRYPVK